MRAELNTAKRHRPRAAPRLEPGERWVLWQVRGRNRDDGHSQMVGYLVTDRERMPRPVAFVQGAGGQALATAAAIRDNPARLAAGGAGVRDYRGFSRRGRRRVEFPRELVGYWLIPIDRLGRPVRGRGCFPWGMYCDGGQLGQGFLMFGRESAVHGAILGPAAVREPRVTWRKAAGRATRAKGGTPAIPSAPSGGTRKSRKGGRQASA